MDLATLFTVVGGTSGVLALIISIWAKFDSQKSNNIAERSEKSAIESNRLAGEANSIAVDARELAKEANTISRRSEARDTETNYVSWDYNWIDTTTCEIVNTGQDKAISVLATVAVDGEHVTHTRIDVDGGGRLQIPMPKLRDKVRRDAAKFRAEEQAFYREQPESPFGISAYDLRMPPMHFPLEFDVVVTIQWLTPLGKQQEKIFQESDCAFSLL